jgi:hypothetical protein
MFDVSDPSIIWVASWGADDGNGTSDSPFQTVDRALSLVRPGNTIVLKPGIYTQTVTIEVSGTIHQPLRIAGENGAEVRAANWFFYDVNNLIVSGLAFRDVPNGAISVIGACGHNRFEDLTFIDCGEVQKSSCTMFFGGSGGACNVVEGCRFELRKGAGLGGGPSIGLMVAEGDRDSGAAIMNHLFRKNVFINYASAIVVGTGDSPGGQYGHIVEYNVLERCTGDALLVKCGDTQVRGNLICDCSGTAIAVRSGSNSVVEANRLVDNAQGISVTGAGHTIGNNCLIRCRGQGIHAAAGQEGGKAENLFIENNTFVDCGGGSSGSGGHWGIACDTGTTGIIRKNLFTGKGRAYAEPNVNSLFLVGDNGAEGGIDAADGISRISVGFRDPGGDDYSNDSGYGAAGWPLTPQGFDPHGDDIDPENPYCAAAGDEEQSEESEEADEGPFESFMEQFYQKDIAAEGERGES